MENTKKPKSPNRNHVLINITNKIHDLAFNLPLVKFITIAIVVIIYISK